MSDKAMPLGRKFKVRLTITPEETGTPVDMLGFTTPVRHDHGCPPRPHDTHVAARQGPSRHPHMGAVHP